MEIYVEYTMNTKKAIPSIRFALLDSRTYPKDVIDFFVFTNYDDAERPANAVHVSPVKVSIICRANSLCS